MNEYERVCRVMCVSFVALAYFSQCHRWRHVEADVRGKAVYLLLMSCDGLICFRHSEQSLVNRISCYERKLLTGSNCAVSEKHEGKKKTPVPISLPSPIVRKARCLHFYIIRCNPVQSSPSAVAMSLNRMLSIP